MYRYALLLFFDYFLNSVQKYSVPGKHIGNEAL